MASSFQLRLNTGVEEILVGNLWVAFEDGAGEGCVWVGVFPVTVQVEGTNCVGQHIENAKHLQGDYDANRRVNACTKW